MYVRIPVYETDGVFMKLKATIMSKEDMERTLIRLAHQIIEKNHGTENICLVGIRSRGVPLAEILRDNIKKIENADVPVGMLDITLYRDDLSKISEEPVLNQTDIPFSVVDKTVVLVDDVIFTGRTARAALDAIMNEGRPSKIQLAVLVDRGHSELPIKATFVGKNLPTSNSEVVSVNIAPFDDETSVTLYEN